MLALQNDAEVHFPAAAWIRLHARGRNVSLMDLCFLEPRVFCLLCSISVIKMLFYLSNNKAWCFKHLMVGFLSEPTDQQFGCWCCGARCAVPLGHLCPATMQRCSLLLRITIWHLVLCITRLLSQHAIFMTGEQWLQDHVVVIIW